MPRWRRRARFQGRCITKDCVLGRWCWSVELLFLSIHDMMTYTYFCGRGHDVETRDEIRMGYFLITWAVWPSYNVRSDGQYHHVMYLVWCADA